MKQPKGSLKLLQAEWYAKLKEAGFKDIEDARGNLRTYDRRTIAFENREQIEEFFRRLDAYLEDHPDLPAIHRHILTRYSQGCFIKSIAQECGRHRWTVMDIIKRYKKVI